MLKALLLYEKMAPSVHMCAYEQLKYLNNNKMIELCISQCDEVTSDMINNSNIIFLIRGKLPLEEQLVNLINRNNKFLVYVLDDDLLNIPEDSASFAYNSRKEVKDRILRIMDKCDMLLSPSPLIIEKYKKHFTYTGLIEEPCMMKKNNLANEKYITGKIKIGYAGSIDRKGDLEAFMEECICELLKKYKDRIEFEFIGAKPSFVEKFNLKHIAYTDNYKDYQKNMLKSSWNIGLAPLTDTKFNNCKHYNKFVEYAGYEIIGIYSNVYPYTRLIREKENGMLCENNSKSWIKAISYLIDNEMERQRILNNINKMINDKFTIDKVSMEFFKIISKVEIKECIEGKEVKEQVKKRKIFLIQLRSKIVRYVEFVQRNGIRTPKALMRKMKRK